MKASHIERRPKRVFLDKDYISTAWQDASTADFAAATKIRAAIQEGASLDLYYRASQRQDTLLLSQGIMHLHLQSKASRAVIYLMQFEQCVLFLRLADHAYLDETPPGRSMPVDILLNRFLKQF